MTIRRKGGRVSERVGQGVDVPPDTAAAPVAEPDVPFGEKGQRFFPDVGFPARRGDLYASAVAHGAPRPILDAIAKLPREQYATVDHLPDLYALAGYRERD